MNIKSLKVCVLCVMTVVFLTSHAWSKPSIVPGQVIIKFSPGSQSADVVEKARRITPPDLASVRTIALALQDRIGVLLKPLRFMADERVLFSIDIDHATHKFKKQLLQHTSITSLHDEDPLVKERLRLPQPRKLLATFAEGSQESELLKQSSHPDKQPALLEELLRHLKKKVNAPIKGEISKSGNFLLWLDLTALTHSVINQLSEEPEIKSAQPNYLLMFQ